MTLPFEFPDWMPWWLQLLAVVVGVLLALCFLFMPFSVFGVKSRLEGVEARLDEIQAEIRRLAHRLPEPGRGMGYDDDAVILRAAAPPRETSPPPIPPASWENERSPTLRAAARTRAEPRLGRK